MKTRIIYGLLAGLCFSLYWLTWRGAILFVGIIGAYLLVQLIRMFLRRRNYLGVISALLVGGFIAWMFYTRIGFSIFTGQTAQATMELASFNILLATHSFSVLALIVPVILALLVYQVAKQGDTSTTLLLVWSVVILVITVVYWRFAYYFAVNVALLTGWFIWCTWQKLIKQDTLRAVLVVGVLCAVAVIPNLQQATTPKNYHTPSDAWCESLEWVKDNTPPDAVILSWWDYGYWINRIADRKAYITPSQQAGPVAETASYFLSNNEDSDIEFDYLILDYATTTSKFRGITIWAGESVGDYYRQVVLMENFRLYYPKYYQSLVVRLYNFDNKIVTPISDSLLGSADPFASHVPLAPVGQYALIYQSEQEIEGIAEVKVFYRRKIIDGQ